MEHTNTQDTAALVVVESMWGHTRAVAEAVADGVRGTGPVLDVGDAPTVLPPEIRLLVVGGPTHALTMSRPTTRHDAAQRGARHVREPVGIREWLSALAPPADVELAVFDTRVGKVRHWPGSAARAAARLARRRGLGQVVATETFYVRDVEGPLLEGELVRARAWGAGLAAAAAARLR